MITPRKALLTVVAITATASSQAALLTSFSDNFNRADGGLGSNYTLQTGTAYLISSGTVQLNLVGNPANMTTLNVGTLPTALDYTNGATFTASMDILWTNQGVTQLAGILLNYQDPGNYLTIAIRGDENNTIQVRGFKGGTAPENFYNVDSGFTKATANFQDNTWYTLSVYSETAGVYDIGLALQGQSPYATGTTNLGGNTLTGGFMGFYGSDGGGPNQYDNLSVTVTSPVPEPSVAALLGTGLIGLAGVRRLIRRRS